MKAIQEVQQSGALQELYRDIHGRILRARDKIAESIFEIGENLVRMQESRAFAVQYETFEDYVRDALGMSKASAYVYITIYKTYVGSGLLQELDRVLDPIRVGELTGVKADSPAGAALSAIGPKKLHALREVMQSSIPVEEKAGWVYRAIQEPSVAALRQAVVREYLIPRGGQVIKSCFNCIYSALARSGERVGGFLVGGKGVLVCKRHMILIGTLTSSEAQRLAEGTDEKPGCPDYCPCPEWKE